MSLKGRNIVLGVTGGIAAYKSPDLVRRLIDAGAQVRVVMTQGAQAFVTPLTFQAVSGHRVHTSLLDAEAEAGMGHIELARWADLLLIAPASADTIARLAAGRADDLLTTVALATQAPLALAPAMNRVMWQHAATSHNCETLIRRGAQLIGPAQGDQACGETGYGRMSEVDEIVSALKAEGPLAQGDGSLAGQRVVVTLGPTREALDPVRYLTNRSSGRMGLAVAMAAQRAGAEVVAVCGPVSLALPPAMERIDVVSAQDMHHAVRQQMADADILFAVAAVADYRVAAPAKRKIKKQGTSWQLDLVQNPDIVAEVVQDFPEALTVAFAAETNDLEANARAKLKNKGCDFIALNEVGEDMGFDGDDNHLIIFSRQGDRIDLGAGSKTNLARALVNLAAEEQTRRNEVRKSRPVEASKRPGRAQSAQAPSGSGQHGQHNRGSVPTS